MVKPNFKNWTLYHGDNLDFLRGMNSNTIDLIATDPPFNKSRDFHATPDSLAKGAAFQDRWSWENDVHQDWVDEIEDGWPALKEVIESARTAHSDGMGAFMCFLAVRLIEMRRILKETGSIYLHCDPTASHYIKAVMDSIFGADNFQNEIVWKRTGSHGGAIRWGPIHDIILFYSASKEYTWNPVYQPYDHDYLENYYRYEDDRGRYQLVSLTGAGTTSGESGKPWRGVDPSDAGRHWAVPMKSLQAAYPKKDLTKLSVQERLELLDKAGLVYWPKKGKKPRHKRYADESPGVPIQDICDVRPLAAHAKERTGYPTQKPTALYERIIEASSNEGDWVLDPFCGCATTILAAERLIRKWIGIDLWEGAAEVVLERLSEEGFLKNPGKSAKDLFEIGEITYDKAPPERSEKDIREEPPDLPPTEKYTEPGKRMTTAEIRERLLRKNGIKCEGCNRTFDHPGYLEVDHNTPRSQGGLHHISNRILLCSPCNRLKSNTLTVEGLQRENKKRGLMANQAK